MPTNPQPANLHAEAYGVPFRIRTPHPEAQTCLPHATRSLQSTPPKTPTFTLPHPTPEALEQLTRDPMIHVAGHAPDRVFVHAGVVSCAGRALMLPGPSFAGKTTLVAALVAAGATYYSDEYAVLDPRGCNHPYTRPLQMRRPGETLQTPTAPAGPVGDTPIRITHVLFSAHAAGATWQPVPITPGAAILEMLRHSIAIQRTPARVLSALGALMRGATAAQSDRGDTDILVPILLRALREGSPLA